MKQRKKKGDTRGGDDDDDDDEERVVKNKKNSKSQDRRKNNGGDDDDDDNDGDYNEPRRVGGKSGDKKKQKSSEQSKRNRDLETHNRGGEDDDGDEQDAEEHGKRKNRRQKARKDEDDDDDDDDGDGDRRRRNAEADGDDYDFTKSSHPGILFFHAIFKIGAVLSYFFMGWIASTTLQYICIVLFNCFDFWTVKNVTGRRLVGMRWWSDFQEDGTEVWRYESYDKEVISNKVDKNLFWAIQLIYTVFWLAFTILNIIAFSPTSIILNLVGLILSGTNLYGYYQCSREHQKKLKSLSKNLMMKGAMYAMRG